MVDPHFRIEEITQFLDAVRASWPALQPVIDAEIASLTENLISADNAETRGRIKALRWIKELPSALHSERESITAALSDESDAA
jgi:hypothetical protein